MRSRTFRMLPAMILMTVLVFAVVFIGSMKTAEAAPTIINPKPDAEMVTQFGNGYFAVSTGSASIRFEIKTCSAWSYQYDRYPHHLWFRLLRNGKVDKFFCAELYQTVKYDVSHDFGQRFGVYTLQVQLDKPDSSGNYHVFGASEFVPEASVTFTYYHLHEKMGGLEPPWDTKYTTDKPATCEEPGSESIHCTVCGGSKPDTAREIPALKHNWKISYTWSKDNKTVTAEAVCRHDSSHKVKEKAIVRQVGKKLVATFANEIFKKQEKDAPGPAVPVAKIKLNKTSAELLITAKKKPTLQLKASITPTNATNKDVVWKSSNAKVATVDKKGKVTVLKTGSVTITCTAADGSKVKATCKIVIKNTLVKKITLNKKNATLKQGNILQLKVKSILPKDAVNRNVKWKSSNKKVAVVDKDGRVTARGKGTCVITCTAADGSKVIAKCKITVK